MVTQSELKRKLHYDKVTGIFTWLEQPPTHQHKVGKEAGCLRDDGYILIGIDDVVYLAHRLAFLYEEGYMPEFVDHKNGKSNAFDNLRPCTLQQNNCNMKLRADNKSGVKGVHFDKRSGKWLGEVWNKGKKHFVGYFTDIEDAAEAVKAKRAELHKEFARNG